MKIIMKAFKMGIPFGLAVGFGILIGKFIGVSILKEGDWLQAGLIFMIGISCLLVVSTTWNFLKIKLGQGNHPASKK